MRLIAEGRHNAICRSVQFAWTSTNKEQVAVEFQIEGPDDPDAGRSITWFGFFTDLTAQRTDEALRNLGWTGTDMAELPTLAEAGQLSQVVEIVVAHEEYRDEIQARVQWVNKPGAGRIKLEKPMTSDELRMFAARMRTRLAGARPTAAAPTARSSAPSAPGLNWGSSRSHAFGRNVPPPAQNDIPF